MSEIKWVLDMSDPKKVIVLLNGDVNRVLDAQHSSFKKNKSELINEIRCFGGETNVIVTIAYKKLLEIENRQQILVDGLLSIGNEHGLKHTVNGILEVAGVEERIKHYS